jgi:hypothetical protein
MTYTWFVRWMDFTLLEYSNLHNTHLYSFQLFLCSSKCKRLLKLYTLLIIFFAFIYLLAEMPGVARVEILKSAIVGRLEVPPAIDSRPDRITPGTHWIGGSNDENGVYPTTQFRL